MKDERGGKGRKGSGELRVKKKTELGGGIELLVTDRVMELDIIWFGVEGGIAGLTVATRGW